jgi:hypothetical protein
VKINCCSIVLSIVFGALLLNAQETRGSILGRVLDSSSAVVPNAEIKAVLGSTSTAIQTKTNEEGRYTLLYLLPGTYTLHVEAPGFKALKRSGIEVRIGDRIELDLGLEVGGTTERVEVTGSTPLLDTTSSSMGQVLDHRRITELPIMHGNPMAVLELAPGLTQSRVTNLGLWGGRVFDNAWTTSFTVNGAGANGHDITLDGVANTTGLGGAAGSKRTVAFTPPVDIVEEFKLQTASFDASVGFTDGATINMAVKSGTRDLHGTGYYFKIPSSLEANQFFANRNGDEPVDYKYNRWGGSLTGPVVLPGVYNGREKTFFSWGYEGHHDGPPWGNTYTVPTPAEKQGDFSALLGVDRAYQIYDPATARLNSDGRVERTGFTNNVIPAARLSSFTTALLKYWPDPLTAGGADGANNYPRPTMQDINHYYSHTARVDHNFSDRDRLYGRLVLSKNIEKDYLDPFDNGVQGGNIIRKNRGVSIDEVHIFSPTLVLDVRYGYTRFVQLEQPTSAGFDPKQVGYSQALVSQLDPQAYSFPCFSISDVSELGCWNGETGATDVHTFSGSLNWMRGSHNIKLGTEARVYRKTGAIYGQSTPALAFGGEYTAGPVDNSPGAPMGQGFAQFLLGVPSSARIERNPSFAEQSTTYAAYLQDDWKVTSKLSLNLGLRWEGDGPMTERYNRTVTGFDYSATSPLAAQAQAAYAQNPLPELPASQFSLKGGLLFAGVGGQPRRIFEAPKTNFMPRFGFAWNAIPNTVIRGGYGIFFGYLGIQAGDVGQYGFSQTTNVAGSMDNGLSFNIPDLSNPFKDGIMAPAGASNGLLTYVGHSIAFFNQHPKSPYSQRWQLSVQRQLPGRVLLDVGYVGNRGTHLQITRNINALPNQYLSTSSTRDKATINRLTERFPSPFGTLLSGTSLAGTTFARTQFLLPYPQFRSVYKNEFDGATWYNALEMKLERRFAQGYTLQGSYTWSKLMDATSYQNGGDASPTRVISAQDFPHRLSLSGIYELPFGKGKPFLANVGALTDRIVGGWQFDVVYTYQSGQALGFGNAIFNGNLHDIPLSSSDRSVDRWFNTDAGFVTASSKQLSYNLVKFSSRFSGIRGDGIDQWNMSLLKNIKITEQKEFQFRCEAINALNHAQFGNPDTSPTSSTFGMVFTEKSSARTFQMGLKFLF